MIHQAGGTVPLSNVFLSETGVSTAEICGVHPRPVSFHSVYLTASVYLSISCLRVFRQQRCVGCTPGPSHFTPSTWLPLSTCRSLSTGVSTAEVCWVHPGPSHSPVSTCLPLCTRCSCFGGCSLTDSLPTRICTTLMFVSSKVFLIFWEKNKIWDPF